jgi:hypothetical protein
MSPSCVPHSGASSTTTPILSPQGTTQIGQSERAPTSTPSMDAHYDSVVDEPQRSSHLVSSW